jgi:hypothetical protein
MGDQPREKKGLFVMGDPWMIEGSKARSKGGEGSKARSKKDARAQRRARKEVGLGNALPQMVEKGGGKIHRIVFLRPNSRGRPAPV